MFALVSGEFFRRYSALISQRAGIHHPVPREIFDLPIFRTDLSSITDALGLALARLTSDDPVHGPGAAVSFAADLLNLFCQLNWTGPPLADFALPFTTPDTLVSSLGTIKDGASLLSLVVSNTIHCLLQSKWNAQSRQSLSWNGEVSRCLVLTH